MALVRWGLIPSWVKDPRAFKMLINARSESAVDKPSFRAALRHKRCLVPADGFYEWTGSAAARRPHLVRPRLGGPMGLAAIYENWLGADGSEIETMAVLTTASNAAMSALHDRMPVIIQPEHFDLWLDCRPGTTTDIVHLLAPPPEDLLEIIEVSRKLNNSRNEGPEVQEPVGTETVDANMFVPIDLLEPILDDLANRGRAARTPRPWLGMYATESQGQLVVNGLATDGPAARAGVKLGDRVLEVAGQRVSGLPDLFRKVWRLGPAGTDIPLTLARGQSRSRVHVRSKDRDELLKKPLRH